MEHVKNGCWWSWEIIPFCKCFSFPLFCSFCFKGQASVAFAERIGTRSTDSTVSQTQQLHIAHPSRYAHFHFSTNHLHYNYEQSCFVFPSLGVSCRSILINRNDASSNVVIKSHISIIQEIKEEHRKRRLALSIAALGRDSPVPVTYLPLPLPFSISKREMFT